MGWKPGQTTRLELGEIPHKRQISDEELTNMRRNAPNREEFELMEKEKQRHNEILDEIRAGGQEEILEFADYYASCTEIDVVDFFNGNLRNNIINFMNSENINHDIDDVMTIFYKKALIPAMYYFAIDLSASDVEFVFTPAAIWDEEQKIDDSGFESYIMPQWLDKISNSRYKINNSEYTPAKARRDLITLGFFENNEIV